MDAPDNVNPSMNMTKNELLEMADELGVETNSSDTKAQIIDKINAESDNEEGEAEA